MVRVVAGFCGSLVYNMIVNNPDGIQKSKESLDLAITFYARGFASIKSVFFESKQSHASNTSTQFKVAPDLTIASFVLQVIWTVIFWGVAISPFIAGGIFSIFKRSEYQNSMFR